MKKHKDNKHPGGDDESDSAEEYDSVDGARPSQTRFPVRTPTTTYSKDSTGAPTDSLLDGGATDRASPASTGSSRNTLPFDEPDGNATDNGGSRETVIYSDNEDERTENSEVCSCQGTGSCVQNILNNMQSEQPDALRTETVNRTGLELIQKHVLVAKRAVYTHTPKDLFSIINRNRGALSVSWMVRQAPQTFLHCAVINKRVEIIPVLVDCGLFLELLDCVVRDSHSDFTGYTAMGIAELHKNEKMIAVLNQQKLFAESFGWMHKCARDGNLTAVKWLIEKHPSLLNKPMTQINGATASLPIQRHTGTEPIYWAVTSGSVPVVNHMLSAGANLHSMSSEGETLLTRATCLGHVDIVKALVEKWHMDTNEPGYEQKTALQRAVANKDVAMVKLLVLLETLVPESLLNDVAKVGHVQMFSFLREHFPNLDLQDEMGKFPLYHALQNDNLQMAEELIKSGAKLTLKDRQQRNLLHLAVSRNNQDTFDFVMRHLKQKKNNKKKFILSELIDQRDRYVGGERCFLVRGKDNGTAAYHYVNVNRFHLNVFRKMTRSGGAIDVVKYGSVITSGWGVTVPADVLESIEKRYEITKVTDTTPADLTPLNLAIVKENYDMANSLIELGADVNITDCFGLTPLHMACMQGSLPVVMHLEKAKAKMTAVDEVGHTALDVAMENQHYHVVNFLKADTVTNFEQLKKFRKMLTEYSAKISTAKLQEARGDGIDIKKQLIDDLKLLKEEINRTCTAFGYSPIMQESCHQASGIMTESSYASQH